MALPTDRLSREKKKSKLPVSRSCEEWINLGLVARVLRLGFLTLNQTLYRISSKLGGLCNYQSISIQAVSCLASDSQDLCLREEGVSVEALFTD